MNGKAIYSPRGKAGEYAKYACNFYVGCSNMCEYCYCKKGILAGAMGQDNPQLKKCFRDESHALDIFEKELKKNLPELQKQGLFFSFTTDPMLNETYRLTWSAMRICFDNNVPVSILTKCVGTEWMNRCLDSNICSLYSDWSNRDKELLLIGFTLTGHDELEPNASTNAERIEAMKKLHDAGFNTWASIEPVIDTFSSLNMIGRTLDFCDLYKVGLQSGKKYDEIDLRDFVYTVAKILTSVMGNKPTVYFKDSLLKQAGINRENLPNNCVSRDYNVFKKH